MKKLLSILLAVCIMAGLAILAAVPAGAEENAYAPPANLGELTQAEQLAYFNLVVNRVRAEKPGFQQRELLEIESMQFSGIFSAVSGIIENVQKALMPGEWTQRNVAVGKSNVGLFMSENANASDLRPQDITSINAAKQGDSWVIELCIQEETNPASGLGSSHGRIANIATREQIIAEITGIASIITISPADTTVRYYDGYARVTVNEQGQVISATNGYQVYVAANNVKISFIQTDVAVSQNSEWQYDKFDWDSAPKWWLNLPPWFQWILRYIFFGWLWMN